MLAFTFLLVAAALAYAVARALKLPSIPFLLLGGIGLTVVRAPLPMDLVSDVLVLGLSVLVFIAGTEMNPRRVRSYRRAALRVGLIQFFLLGAAGFAAATFLGYGIVVALYLALGLTASSTVVVVRLLQQRKQLFEPFGRLVIGVLLLQDLLIILLIPAVVRIEQGWGAVLLGFGGVLLLVALSFATLRWVTPFVVVRLGLDEESLLLVVLTILFLFLGAGDVLGLPLFASAFLAGLSLSTFPVSGIIRGQLNSLSDFFTAVFFTALGASLVMPTVSELMHVLVFALMVLLLTPPLIASVAERYGLSARPALESGLLLAQTSEFSLLLALQGLVLEQISQGVFTVIALVTATTMVLTPLFATDRMTWSLLRFHPVLRKGVDGSPPREHVLLLGCGENGMPLLETLVAAGHEVVVVDDDPQVIDRLREGDVRAIRGDGSDPEVLRAAGTLDARIVVSTIRRPLDNEPLLRHVRGRVPVLVRVFDTVEAEQIRELGGIAIPYAEAAADDFFRWLESAETVGLENERRTRAR
jgi:Kef-type K+ transport system membrane component KefB